VLDSALIGRNVEDDRRKAGLLPLRSSDSVSECSAGISPNTQQQSSESGVESPLSTPATPTTEQRERDLECAAASRGYYRAQGRMAPSVTSNLCFAVAQASARSGIRPIVYGVGNSTAGGGPSEGQHSGWAFSVVPAAGPVPSQAAASANRTAALANLARAPLVSFGDASNVTAIFGDLQTPAPLGSTRAAALGGEL
jgi:hypothetical protein